MTTEATPQQFAAAAAVAKQTWKNMDAGTPPAKAEHKAIKHVARMAGTTMANTRAHVEAFDATASTEQMAAITQGQIIWRP